jgi:opacity protein-like surface antigen
MPRQLTSVLAAVAALGLGVAGGRAHAQSAPSGDNTDDLGDQAISGELGIATGGRVTPGGLRIAGHYLYQLSDNDWFEGSVAFTFGSSAAACFRDRADKVICKHGVADGTGVELLAGVRHYFAARGAFRPFAHAGLGVGLVRFADDDVSGTAIPLHGGGGLRVAIHRSIALVFEGDLALGFGLFNRDLGVEPLFGLAVIGGAEFRLR